MVFQDPDRILGIVPAVRTTVSASDSDVPATFAAAHDADSAGGRLNCINRSTVVVKADFSLSTATALARVLYYREVLDDNGVAAAGNDELIGMSDAANLNATTQENGAGRFLCPVQFVACEGFAKYRVKIESLSAGNVTVYSGTVL
jgi:hypothetical protein